jgi:hypothetical protein
MKVAVWIVSALLALAYLGSGFMKLVTPLDELAQKMAFVTYFGSLTRAIGAAEVLGALGLLLPAATRIKPMLTPIAASGLAVLMLGAVVTHVVLGEANHVAVPLVLAALSAFVAWARVVKVPVLAR